MPGHSDPFVIYASQGRIQRHTSADGHGIQFTDSIPFGKVKATKVTTWTNPRFVPWWL